MSAPKTLDIAKRLPCVDWLRGLAMLAMIQAHAVFFWSPWYPLLHSNQLDYHHPLYKWVDIDTYAAPAFLFLAGFSLYWWHKNHAELSPSQQQWQVFKRGLIIFALGLIVSGLKHGHWMLSDILNTTGVSLMVLSLLWRMAKH